MASPRVLVSAPVSEMHAYCYAEFVAGLRAISYDNFNIILVDNSKTEDFANRLTADGFKVVRLQWYEQARMRVCQSHNKLRELVLQNNYDYLLTLDQDTIPPQDILQKLLKHNQDVVAGLYFGQHFIEGKPMRLPFAWVFREREGFWGKLHYLDSNEFSSGKLLELGMAGTGCVLISKKVLGQIQFRYDNSIEAFDDRWLFYDCHRLGIQPYVDTDVICNHLWKARPFDWGQVMQDKNKY